MNKREDALIEALQKNAAETERWKAYLKENETAKENLSMFQKHLSVEVMVPMGKKALLPGHLIHTNEVLVGHYQGYFSKCSAFKASEVCDLRIRTAKEHLNKLEKELQLWQNKLETPYKEGMFATGEEREIIEDYDEEKEKLWREKHRQRVRKSKEKEKQKRESQNSKASNEQEITGKTSKKSDEDILKMLEDAEIMEELENELNYLEVDEVTDDTIRKLMTGEMTLPAENKRIAHDRDVTEENMEKSTLSNQIVKKATLQDNVPQTNNNIITNSEISADYNTDEDSEVDDIDALPEEVKIIREQAEFLSKEDQIGFYEYQIEIIRQKVASLPQRSKEQIDEKIRLFNVLEHLEEFLEIAETALGNEELSEKEGEQEDMELKQTESDDEKDKISNENKKTKQENQKRRISFALEDETLEFCKTETVTQMLPDNRGKPKRDIITLDDDIPKQKDDIIPLPISTDKKDLIQAKVEQNRQFVSETQSEHDYDLVNKILETSIGNVNTLHIQFKHSQQIPSCTADEALDIAASPADFYIKYTKISKETEPTTLFVNSYEGEDLVKTPFLKEADKQQAFENPKAAFSNPKSILRNKEAIEKNHTKSNTSETIPKKQKKKKRTPKEEEESISAYNKVMNDVVEKPLIEPEPLPAGKYIDAHAPQKRVSRFKQMRQGTEQT